MSQHRKESDAFSATSGSTRLGRAPSAASSLAKPVGGYSKPPLVAAGSYSEPAPPPYSGTGASGVGAKRAPPPPPAPKPRPGATQAQWVTALYDYAATAEGDLSFSAGDKIELVKKTESAEDWWTGKLAGQEGIFPGRSLLLWSFSNHLSDNFHMQEITSNCDACDCARRLAS